MSPKRTGMHFLFCFVDLALIAPNIRWIRRFSAAAQHLIMVHFNLSPLFADYLEVDYNHFDAGMNIGVGLWYDRFNLDFTYQRGFIDVFSDLDGIKTSNFMIRLGIAF